MTSTLPLVSIVIPIYNAEDYLGECLDSLLNQTLKQFEIICVDDSSTDSSMAILEEYERRDSRISVISQNKSNAGEARNHGMERAVGEYIIFIDADDFCEPEMIEVMYNKAIELNADTVVCRTKTYSMKTRQYAIPSYTVRAEMIPETATGCFWYQDCPNDIFQLFCMAPWNKLFRLKMLKDNDIVAQSIPAANDVLLTASALMCSQSITVVDKFLYTQRKDNPSSITGRLDLNEKWKCGAFSSQALKSFLEDWGLYATVRRSYRKQALHSIVWYLDKVRSTDLTAYRNYYHFLKEGWLARLDLADIEPADAQNASEYASFEAIRYSDFDDLLLDDIAKLQKEIWRRDKELSKIKRGKNYRLGKALLKYPRKTIRSVRTLREQIAILNHDRSDPAARKRSTLRVCVVAYEGFHYSVTGNVLKIALARADYIEAYVCKKSNRRAEGAAW